MAVGATTDTDALKGWRVLVTRPAGRTDALGQELQALGAQVFVAPLLTIEPLPFTPELREIAQHLDRYDIVVITSANAVQAWLPRVADFWPQRPVDQTWIAVGAGTAAALGEFGIPAQVPAESTSEGLLALPLLTDVNQRRVLLVAGEGGRDAIENTLRKRGAVLTRIATYRRVPSDAHRLTIDAFGDKPEAARTSAVLVTSAAALQNLLALAPWLHDVQPVLVVASERIAALARNAGIARVCVAGGADDAQQIKTLLQLAKTHHDEDCA